MSWRSAGGAWQALSVVIGLLLALCAAAAVAQPVPQPGVGLTPQRIIALAGTTRTLCGHVGQTAQQFAYNPAADPWGDNPRRRLSLAPHSQDSVLHARRFCGGQLSASGRPYTSLAPTCGHTDCAQQLQRLFAEAPAKLGLSEAEAATYDGVPTERELRDCVWLGCGPEIQRRYAEAFGGGVVAAGAEPWSPRLTTVGAAPARLYVSRFFGSAFYWEWGAWEPCRGVPQYAPDYPRLPRVLEAFGEEPDCSGPPEPPPPTTDPDPPVIVPPGPQPSECCGTASTALVRVEIVESGQEQLRRRVGDLEERGADLRRRLDDVEQQLLRDAPRPRPPDPVPESPGPDPPTGDTQAIDLTFEAVARGRRGEGSARIALPPGTTRAAFDLEVQVGADLCDRTAVIWVGPAVGAAGGTSVDQGFCGLIINGRRGTSLLHSGSTPQERLIAAGGASIWRPGARVRVQLTCDVDAGASLIAGGEHLTAPPAPGLWSPSIAGAQVGLSIDWDHKPGTCDSCGGWCWGRLGGTSRQPWRITGTVTTIGPGR